MEDQDAKESGNVFRNLPGDRSCEAITPLAVGGEFEFQRIISFGHASPPGFWYDEPRAEWVLLLAGAATLQFEGETEPRRLEVGDYLLIPAHCRHRVDWTDPDTPTIWVVLLYRPT